MAFILSIEISQLNNLNQTFPFKIFRPELEHAALPDNWRYAANFQMYGFSYDISMPELYGKWLNIAFTAKKMSSTAICYISTLIKSIAVS